MCSSDLDPVDITAPAHLEAMETVSRQVHRLTRAGQSWVADLWILLDHPQRWPELILYEHQSGGILKDRFDTIHLSLEDS